MKSQNRFVLFFLVLFSLTGCEPPDDDPILEETSTVFLEQALAEIFLLNGQAFIPTSFDESSSLVVNFVDRNLVTGPIASFSTRSAAPWDNTVTINASLENAFFTTLTNPTTQIPPFFQGGTVGDVISVDTNSWLDFTFNFTYPEEAPEVLINEIDIMEFVYSFEYTDTNTGELLNTKVLTHRVVFQ